MIQQSTLDILEKIKSFKILLSTKKKKTKNFNVLLSIREENKILSNFIQIYCHSRIPVNNEIWLRWIDRVCTKKDNLYVNLRHRNY